MSILNRVSVAQPLIDAFPSAVFLMDEDLKVHGANKEAARFLGATPEFILKRICGEAIHCLHNQESPTGCGTTKFCKDCVIRKGVKTAFEDKSVFRKKHEMVIERQGVEERVCFLVTSSLFKHETDSFALVVLEDITQFIELGRILPICSNCRKIRDDKNYWESFENYLKRYSSIDFTHSICPECAEKLYGYKTGR